jgi:hypothetical protein
MALSSSSQDGLDIQKNSRIELMHLNEARVVPRGKQRHRWAKIHYP